MDHARPSGRSATKPSPAPPWPLTSPGAKRQASGSSNAPRAPARAASSRPQRSARRTRNAAAGTQAASATTVCLANCCTSAPRCIFPVVGCWGNSFRRCRWVPLGSRRCSSRTLAATGRPSVAWPPMLNTTAAWRCFARSSQTRAASLQPASRSCRSTEARSNHLPPTFAKPSARPQYSREPSGRLRARSRVRKCLTGCPWGPRGKSTKAPQLRAGSA
mmetsp:Transcript_42647/g.132976  ORF Transcript_42647/g.132976 Transcript_42647/m.132976 type:complete len:218 (+) Transcript_42647:383-1036(+)